MRAKKRPIPHPGSRTRPPEKPMRRSARQMARTINSGVKCAYCVTRARLCELGLRDELLEVLAQRLPALREGLFRRSAEERVCQLARAERREEGEAVLFLSRGVPRLVLDLEHQPDGRDVVRRARLPVGGEAASARETEVARGNDSRSRGVVFSLGDRVVDRLTEGEAGIEAHRGSQGGRVEERQAQLIGVRLHWAWDLSGVRDRPAGAWKRRRDPAHGD